MLPSGTYVIGKDLQAGSYHFTQIEGDGYVPVLYVYNPDDLENAVASGSAKEAGCVLNLQEGQILKITWTGVNVSRFSSDFTEGSLKLLPTGSYVIGMDIPAGSYHFTQIEGDGYVPVLYVFNPDDLENEFVSVSAKGKGCVLNLKNGQILKITWTGTNVEPFSPDWIDKTANLLPSGLYIVGEDLPGVTYNFTKIEGDGYTAVMYIYDTYDLYDPIQSGSVNQKGYSTTLFDGQVIRITWAGVIASLDYDQSDIISNFFSSPTPNIMVPTPVATEVTSATISDNSFQVLTHEESEANSLKGMNYYSLIDLESEVERVMYEKLLVDGIELPLGNYIIGEEIPEGRYVISATREYSSPIIYIQLFDSLGNLTSNYEIQAGKDCSLSFLNKEQVPFKLYPYGKINLREITREESM